MSDTPEPLLRKELLDDFYAECDELFDQVREHLAFLDGAGGHLETPAARNALQSLFRCLHTFKGNCGIVGLRSGEQLAHAMEDILRQSDAAQPLNSASLELIARAVHQLERIVAAFRDGESPAEPEELIAALRRAGSGEGPAATSSTESPIDCGLRYVATFAPTKELDARGININSVRERLSTLGKIVSAVPVVSAGGISFTFTLSLPLAPADLASWNTDGLALRSEAAPQSAAPAASAANAGPAASAAPTHLVRVDLGRLDDLMRILGELVIHRSRLEERIAAMPGDRSAFQEINHALGRSLRDLRAGLTRVRLVPVAEIFSRLPYVVRDLAHETGRTVRLVIEGRETAIDKYLVERLKEPLLHLVRNAISHGIETPAERRASGKPEEATLTLRAFSSGQTVVIEIQDDGRGIDHAKVFARAAALGLPVPKSPTSADVLALLCHAGFSTREQADLAAGRGIGMAVVQATLRELTGQLSFESEVGRGTQFTLRLPLTLSIADALIVSAGAQTCAVPQGSVEQVIQCEESEVRTVQQTEVLPYRDQLIPLVRLGRLLGETHRRETRIPVLIIASEYGATGLVVDRVHGQREVVVRPLADPLLQVRGISGATELGDGRAVLILDPAELAPRASYLAAAASHLAKIPSPAIAHD